MRFRIESSVIFYRLMLALVLILSGSLSAEAQCSPEQIVKLIPNDGAAEDRFGGAVTIDGSTAIVGAPGGLSGSAYVFDTKTDQQIHKLVANDGAEGDAFGISVAISGSTAIVGASRDDDSGNDSGSAYLFDTTTGQQMAKLLPADGAADNRFGFNVAISGTTAIVGAYLDDDNGEDSGSAYLFDTTTGQQIAKLLPDGGAEGDNFGTVAISASTAIVGALGDDDNGNNSGSAYLFDITTGQQIAKLLPDDGVEDDFFGHRVAVNGSTAIVGASGDDDSGNNSGSAYVFDITTGQLVAKLLPDDGAADDRFGIRVWISGTTAIVSARSDDDNGEDSGSAYLFDTTTGQQIAKLLPDDGATGDIFGSNVSINGTTAIVGASKDDDNGEDSGSAYLFDVSSCVVLLGDVNLDGSVDLLDVAPFVALLTSGDFQAEADINQDGVVNLLDVQPFVDLLTG